MIVVDASVILELLLRRPATRAIEPRLFRRGETLHAPHLLDLEVAQVLRCYAAKGELGPDRGDEALEDLRDLGIHRYAHEPFLSRIWKLRGNLTAYDAAYVALAEALDAPLLTRDRKMAQAQGHRAKIEVI